MQVAIYRDRDAFLRIYSFFMPRVCLYLRGLGALDGVAEDLGQDALLRLWQQSQHYDSSRGALSTWLFRIARNLYFDKLRREPKLPFLQEEAIDAEPNPTPDRTESYAEHMALHQRIDALPAIQARLIRMSYFEAKSHQEIATELNMPLGTVKSHVRRAFMSLQSSIGPAK